MLYLTQYYFSDNRKRLLAHKFKPIDDTELLIEATSRKVDTSNWYKAGYYKILLDGETQLQSGVVPFNRSFILLNSQIPISFTWYQIEISPVFWVSDLRVRFYRV